MYIDNCEQNKPSLIAEDLKQYVPFDIIMRVLLNRGVFKWLAVRRNLIKLKGNWKNKISLILQKIRVSKEEGSHMELWYNKGYLKAYEECRKEIRNLCHSPRWQAPDFDKKAILFLEEEYNRIKKEKKYDNK